MQFFTRTFRKGCKAGFFIKLTGYELQIRELNEEHCHESSLSSFRTLHHQRLKLPENVKANIKDSLTMGANKKLVQNQVINQTGCNITLKDLTNINRTTNKEKNFEECVEMLKDVYKCKVEVFVRETENDDDKMLQAFYFQDKHMKNCYKAFPEVMFMDGTYCLMNNRASCYLLMVEDSNGRSEVVAVCFMFEENLTNIDWFIETFKNNNESWEKTEVIMTDKDAKERDVLRKQFPKAHLLICFFHVMQIFRREISSKNMPINSEESKLSRCLLEKIAYSATTKYDLLYEEFTKTVPPCVVEYYNKNWHPIKEQWVLGFTHKTQCFLNKTNNRLECVNSKLKSVIKRYSSMEMCLQNLFIVINSMRLEIDAKVAAEEHKIRTSSLKSSVHEHFEKLLTPYAFDFVENSLNKKYKDGCFSYIGDNTFLFQKSDLLLKVTPHDCECSFRCSMGLPCGHILECRKKLEMNLFDESLCLERWKRSYYRKHQRILKSSYDVLDVDLNENLNIKYSKTSSATRNLSSQQKFKLMQDQCIHLCQLGSEVGKDIFLHRYDIIKTIVHAWTKGEEVAVSTSQAESFQQCEESTPLLDHTYFSSCPNIQKGYSQNVIPKDVIAYSNIVITDEDNENLENITNDISEDCDVAANIVVCNESVDLSTVKIPTKIRKRGRPKGFGVTVIGLPVKKKKNE